LREHEDYDLADEQNRRQLRLRLSPLRDEGGEEGTDEGRAFDHVIQWLTGFDEPPLGGHLAAYDVRGLLRGSVCQPARDPDYGRGVRVRVRVENVADPLMRKIRYLDKWLTNQTHPVCQDNLRCSAQLGEALTQHGQRHGRLSSAANRTNRHLDQANTAQNTCTRPAAGFGPGRGYRLADFDNDAWAAGPLEHRFAS
jgi:hypothetical protein